MSHIVFIDIIKLLKQGLSQLSTQFEEGYII